MTESVFSIKDSSLQQYLNNENIDSKSKIFDFLINYDGEVFRNVKSRKTLKLCLAQSNYFIKKHYPITIIEFFKNIISLKNPFVGAWHEYRAILALNRLNIKTMDVAVIASSNKKKLIQQLRDIIINLSKGRVGATSFLVTKSIEPNIELDKFCMRFKDQKEYFKLKRVLIKHIAQVSRKLHLNGLNHRDYYLCHFLLKLDISLTENLGSFDDLLNNIYLIDLHRMQIRQSTPERYVIKDLSALLFSARDLGLTKVDKLRFVKYYINITDRNKFKKFMLNEVVFWDRIIIKANSLKEKG